jgi:hypothetical protein
MKKNLKILSICFAGMDDNYTTDQYTGSRILFEKLHLNKIMKSYEVIHFLDSSKYHFS